MTVLAIHRVLHYSCAFLPFSKGKKEYNPIVSSKSCKCVPFHIKVFFNVGFCFFLNYFEEEKEFDNSKRNMN